jgi:hypothetical protein
MRKGLHNFMADRYYSFLAAVRIGGDGGEALLVDTGAYDGLAGSEWFDEHIKGVKNAGLGHMITEKPTSIVVSGVGKDSEKCSTVQSVPGVLEDGTVIQYDAPRIPGCSVPALCGMQTLDEQNMGVLPWSSQLVKVPKGKEKDIIWPEGTTFLQCQRAKTGHMMLPIGHFSRMKHKPEKSQLAFTADYIFERQAQLQKQDGQSHLTSATYTHVPQALPVSANL